MYINDRIAFARVCNNKNSIQSLKPDINIKIRVDKQHKGKVNSSAKSKARLLTITESIPRTTRLGLKNNQKKYRRHKSESFLTELNMKFVDNIHYSTKINETNIKAEITTLNMKSYIP